LGGSHDAVQALVLGLQVMTLMTSLPLVLDRADLTPTSTVVDSVVDRLTAAAAAGGTGVLDLSDVTPLQEAVDAVALSALYAQPKRRDVAAAMATMNQVMISTFSSPPERFRWLKFRGCVQRSVLRVLGSAAWWCFRQCCRERVRAASL
jgi:hypothetical protein